MTELIWEGKYDKDGRKVAPLRVRLPFQTVETVNEDSKQRQISLEMFAGNRQTEWRNRLIWGDKKYVLPALLEEFAGQINLIYIDPPFGTGQNFSFDVSVGTEEFTKQPSVIEQKAYRDTWGRGLDSYIQWFSESAMFLLELLTENGSLFVHLDNNVSHFIKALLDEVIPGGFQAQIIWQRVTGHSDRHGFGTNYDVIFHYSKNNDYKWFSQYVPHSEDYLNSHYTQTDEKGRRFRWDNATATGSGPARIFFGKSLEPPLGTHWRWSQERIDELSTSGRIVLTSRGKPQYKRYLDEMPGKVIQSVWTDIPPVNSQATEDTGFATQKPEELLHRILNACSRDDDLILDCFAGSGTTVAVAEKLNRRWIACDLGRFAIHTTRKRLLNIPNVKPFVVQNLGKYERQLWQSIEFGEHSEEKALAYRSFILDLYHAQPMQGYTWLHGVKSGRMVHVGAVDSPVSPGDISQIAIEFKKAIGTGKAAPSTNGIDVLGWDFAFELNEVARQQAAQANINMRFLRIPREVLEKKAVEQGDMLSISEMRHFLNRSVWDNQIVAASSFKFWL
jgi:adenine-specific DNA-methyltransferase